MQIIVDSLLVNYKITGKGKKNIVMLHGWGDSLQTFESLASIFKTEFTIILIDLPGFGKSQAPKTPWGLTDYSDFVAHFLNKLKINDLHCIIGHSNGGAIAIRGLASGKIQANKLVLLASAGIRNAYNGRNSALRTVAKIVKLATRPLSKNMQIKLKERAYRAVGSDLFVAEHLQETFKKVVTDDVQQDAKRLTLSTLIIYGSQDTATPPRFGELFTKQINNSTFCIIDGAGHFVHHDEPNKVADLIYEFIK